MAKHLGCEPKHVACDCDGNVLYDPFILFIPTSSRVIMKNAGRGGGEEG